MEPFWVLASPHGADRIVWVKEYIRVYIESAAALVDRYREKEMEWSIGVAI